MNSSFVIRKGRLYVHRYFASEHFYIGEGIIGAALLSKEAATEFIQRYLDSSWSLTALRDLSKEDEEENRPRN